jgi:hypothetical protein
MNPRETLVLLVRQEYTAIDTGRFNDLLYNLRSGALSDDLRYFYDPNFSSNNRSYDIPPLGAVRGNIVFLNSTYLDQTESRYGVGVQIGGWDTTSARSDDLVEIEDHLTASNTSTQPKRVFLTLCSSWSPSIATDLNDPLTENLDVPGHPQGKWGAVFLSKPPQALVEGLCRLSLQTFPNPSPVVPYLTTQWLKDAGADIDHQLGQDNVALLSQSDPEVSLKQVEIMWKGGYGIINLRFSQIKDGQTSRVIPFRNYSCDMIDTTYSQAWGDGWMGTDFDGVYMSVSDPNLNIINVTAGYQAGYGLINMQVVYSNHSFSTRLTPFNDVDCWTPMMHCFPESIRFIGTWRQDRYGLTDFQVSVNV